MSFASFTALTSFSAYEEDRDKPALGIDPAFALVRGGVEPLSTTSGIFEKAIVDKLRDAQRQVIVDSSGGRFVQLLLFVLCALCGSMLPLVQDWTKVYPESYTDSHGDEYSCEGRIGSTAECKGGLPYLPGAAVVADKLTSLVVGLLMTAVLSGREGLRQCVNPVRLRMTGPIAIFYCTGDIVQFMAIGATNAAFFLVIGQTKLLATALMAMLVLSTRQSTAQWFLLGAVTVTCGLYCDLDLLFIQQKDRGKMEAYGLLLSLTKVCLAAVNAVFTERAFKASGSEPIWVNQVQLKICSLPCSIILLFLQYGIFCNPANGICLSMERGFFNFFTGWSEKNAVLLGVQVFNNFIIGLVYKKVNAVVKYLAYAQSLWITYLVNMCLLGVAFNIDLFLVIILLVLLVIAYSFAKVDSNSAQTHRASTPGILSPAASPALGPALAPAFPRGAVMTPAMSSLPALGPAWSPTLGPSKNYCNSDVQLLSPVLSFSSFETQSKQTSEQSKDGKATPKR